MNEFRETSKYPHKILRIVGFRERRVTPRRDPGIACVFCVFCVCSVCVLCEWYYGPSVHPGILHVDSDGPCVVSDGPRGHVRPVVDCRIQGRCRAEPAIVLDVDCRAR